MRLIDGVLPNRQLVLAKAQVIEPDANRTVVENTHHDLLTHAGGEVRETQFPLAPVHHRAEASILRRAPLGVVEVRHDLRRDTIAGCIVCGGFIASNSTPSMR